MLNIPKLIIIVTAPRGVVIRDTPRPESEGGLRLRNEPVGKQLLAYGIHEIAGVPYARLVPQNPQKPEWVRVSEANGDDTYVDVIPMDDETESKIAEAITSLANAIRDLASAARK